MKATLDKQRSYFLSDATKDYKFRLEQLDKLYNAIKDKEEDILEALEFDLGKSRFEAYTTEIGITLKSIRVARKQLKKWMKKRRVKTPFYLIGAKSYIQAEPLGNVLIIGPYNYPFYLVIEPLIGAIAAGNTVVIKPSEYTSAIEAVIREMMDSTFDDEYIKVFTGDKTIAQKLLEHRFDHIFFTGSTKVGQIVYEAASKHLTPVTLELGGKSPAIIDRSANIKVAARRIVFGKFLNAGQTCIAPDFLYVDATIKDKLIAEIKQTLDAFYPNLPNEYGRIVNQDHFDRLSDLIDDARVVHPYKIDRKQTLITPVLMTDITFEDAIMQEEIFGPILPIITYNTLDEAIQTLKQKEKPLALYLFTSDKKQEEKVFNALSFGGGAVNDTIQHVANIYLPFGGVGASGFGVYHGKHSFDTFSNMKAFIKRTTKLDPSIAYPPYKKKEKWIRKILK